MFFRNTLSLQQNLDEECKDSLRRDFESKFIKLGATNIRFENGILKFNAAQYTSRNVMVYVLSGKICFLTKEKKVRYNINLWNTFPGFLITITGVFCVVFVPELRNRFVYFFISGSFLVYFFITAAIWYKFDRIVRDILRNFGKVLEREGDGADKLTSEK